MVPSADDDISASYNTVGDMLGWVGPPLSVAVDLFNSFVTILSYWVFSLSF